MYIAIDLGGTTTRLAVFPQPHSREFVAITDYETIANYDAALARLVSEVSAYRQSDVSPLTGVGVSIGGRLARDGRSVEAAPNLSAYVGRPLADELGARLGAKVAMAHDTVCGVLAEGTLGALNGVDRGAYLTLSTGTGAALGLGVGANRLAISIEFGHQILDGNAHQCLCGQIGCLETFTGGRQLSLRYGGDLRDNHEPDVWAEFTHALALGLVNLAQLTRVEMVAVGGAIAINRPELLPLIQAEIDQHLRGMSLTLRPAMLGADAPLVGASLLPDLPRDTMMH